MDKLNYKSIFNVNNKEKLKLYFFSLFFIFSILLLGLNFLVSQYLIQDKIDHELEQNLQIEYTEKKEHIKHFVDSQKYYLHSITSHNLLFNYIRKPQQYQDQLTDYLLSIAKTSPSIMQLRFLDKIGKEKVKIVRNSIQNKPLPLDKTLLQNKQHRYYFKEIENLQKDETWFSKIDLNMEHGKVQTPIVPTLRVAKSIFIDNKFEGVIIINLFVEKFLQEITNSLYFHIAIVNEKKEYIQHHNNTQKNWSEYFPENGSFLEDICVLDKKIINKITQERISYFTKEIGHLIPNNDLSLVFIPKKDTFKQIQAIQTKYIFYLIIITFFISIPISIFLSRFPFNYTKELLDSKHRLLELVNENVLYSSSDLEGNITDVSQALCRFTKYSKEELIGKNHNIFRHPDTPDQVFQNLWSTILKGNIWSGELKNIDKDFNTFWINATISPNFKNNEIVGFTAIRENITDRKIIEALSITDELTTLYNKRFFNKTFPKEIKRAKRLKTNFVFVILDIDNFKLYNDTYGHKEGDSVLQEIGVLIRKMFKRSYDFAFRIGGEEFAIIFTEKDSSKIYPYIERIGKAIKDLNIEHQFNSHHKIVTASIGYRIMSSDNILSETEIYKQADIALYKAKKSGRNTVINYDDIKPT